MSKQNRAVEYAYDAGYRVVDGVVFNPNGVERKVRVKSASKKIGTNGLRVGYATFTVKFEGGSFPINVHKLVAYQKFGKDAFSDGVVVRHIDGDRLNNSESNIEIGSHRDNIMDRSAESRLRHAQHAANHNRKYDKDAVIAYHATSSSYKETMNKFGIKSSGTLHNILNGRKR